MISGQNVLYVSLKEMSRYQNIRNLGITKAATLPKLFPCEKIIRWILPHKNSITRIISNIKGEAFSSFTPTYITLVCKLPPTQVMMANDWVKKVDMDILECTKKMMIPENQLSHKETGEYESLIL